VSLRPKRTRVSVSVLKGINVYAGVNVYALDGVLRCSNMNGWMFGYNLSNVYRAAGARSRNANVCLCVLMLSVIHRLLGDGVGGSNDARADGGEPGVLLVLRVGDEHLGLSHAGNLERPPLSSLIHRAGDGETVP
jgi:hypothetical protein